MMSTVVELAEVTPDDLLQLPDQKSFELVDGELLERKVSVLSSWVGGHIARLLGNHVESEQIGWIFPADNGYQCFPDRPKTVRRPDVSFVSSKRMTWEQFTHGWFKIVPDLIVEVISPNDLAYQVDEKIEMFLKVGVPLIWVVNPDVRTIRVIRGDGSTQTLRNGDQLSGEDVIPGFACSLATIFPPKPMAPASEAAPTV